MRRRAKRILIAAATLIAAGAAVAVGVQQANIADAEPLTCAEWRRVVRQHHDNKVTAFAAIKAGTVIPKTGGDYIIGDCSGGTCSIGNADCPGVDITYDYYVSSPVATWRLLRFYAPKPQIRAIKEAAAVTAGLRFYRGWKDVAADCLAHFTGAQCRTLFSGVVDCWKLANGNLCRGGLEYGPGKGGRECDISGTSCTDFTCAPAAGSIPYPCEDEGRGDQWAEHVIAADFPSDAELVQ